MAHRSAWKLGTVMASEMALRSAHPTGLKRVLRWGKLKALQMAQRWALRTDTPMEFRRDTHSAPLKVSLKGWPMAS
eukprot:2817136-Prorocentrum_lima.AAC.1